MERILEDFRTLIFPESHTGTTRDSSRIFANSASVAGDPGRNVAAARVEQQFHVVENGPIGR